MVVRTLAGEEIDVGVEVGGGTVRDVAEAIERRLHLAQGEQMYVARGQRLEPTDALHRLVDDGDAGTVTVHLVRRPDPGRSISVHLRVAGAARARHVMSVRADATVCQVQAAALASLREAGVAVLGGTLRLTLGGKVLEPDLANCGRTGARRWLHTVAVPSRREGRNVVGRGSACRSKSPRSRSTGERRQWLVRQGAGSALVEDVGRWEGSSALYRRARS